MKRCCISFYEFSMRIGSEAGVGRWWSSLQLCGCNALQNDLSKLKQLEKLEVYLLILRNVVESAYHSKGRIPVVILPSDFVSLGIFLPFFFGCLAVPAPIPAATVGAGFREQLLIVMAQQGSCRVCSPSPFAMLLS